MEPIGIISPLNRSLLFDNCNMTFKNIIYLLGFIIGSFLSCSCADNAEELKLKVRDGSPAVAYISIGNQTSVLEGIVSRATYNSYDHWSVATFGSGDFAGMYAAKGMQDPNNEESYDLEIKNVQMEFESASGSNYKFANFEVILSPQTVHDNYSIMYYPYYKDMPDPYATEDLAGIPLRKLDPKDNIEKCIDFMETSKYTYQEYNIYYSPSINYLPISDGLLQPRFYHYMSEIVIQRGEGFDSPSIKDKRIWVIMTEPYTDLRITRASEEYNYKLQNILDKGEKLSIPSEENPKITVNKNRVWEAWPGNNYNNKESYYAIIPPEPAKVAYIMLQDNKGDWQVVSDFYLATPKNTTSKSGYSNCRYIVTVESEGLNVKVRPVLVEEWIDGGSITDQYSAGINTSQEFKDWVGYYNAYTLSDRDPSYEKDLSKFGTGQKNTATGYVDWTFYLNCNLDLNKVKDIVINKFEDALIGASVYTNYKISNLQTTLISNMGEKGKLQAIDFWDLYIIDIEENNEFFTGGLINKMEGGTIDNCNIINGILVSNKGAGIIAGAVASGNITNCRFTGQVIGTSTISGEFAGLFGCDPDDLHDPLVDKATVDYKELYFETYNDN